ncbi:MAG: hypothetical protein U9N82_00270 [Thermodesulfobacteriota bacterium]|nr:hypothetical protein [Thermodesulfobacteriota bacterium]
MESISSFGTKTFPALDPRVGRHASLSARAALNVIASRSGKSLMPSDLMNDFVD